MVGAHCIHNIKAKFLSYISFQKPDTAQRIFFDHAGFSGKSIVESVDETKTEKDEWR